MKTKIYTKGGDLGQTSILGGPRLSKADSRLAAYGSIDELNAFIGLAIAASRSVSKLDGKLARVITFLTAMQNQLFVIGSHLACADDSMREKLPIIETKVTTSIEQEIDALTADLPELRQFILPGGANTAANLHVCRTVCRRAEREVVYFLDTTEDKTFTPALRAEIVTYLNRLGDYLFVLARWTNFQLGATETPWQK